jgi:hypothetical protein
MCGDVIDGADKQTGSASTLFRHFGRHLQQLSLSSLPLSIDGLEIVNAQAPSGEETSSVQVGSGSAESIETERNKAKSEEEVATAKPAAE